jgi:hypothetical protein
MRAAWGWRLGDRQLGGGGVGDRGSRGTFNPTPACAAWPCVRRGVAASTDVRCGRRAVVARSPSVAGVGSREGDERTKGTKDPGSGVRGIRDISPSGFTLLNGATAPR